MFALLNVLALVGTAAVAFMGTLQGLYRSVMTLAACVVAGAAAFGLFGPAAGLLDSGNPNQVWYYAADALALWVIFGLGFLGLRTLGERLLKVQPTLPPIADQIGGAVVGAVTGYLAVGMCLVLAQMLPMPPAILGYAPFQYRAGKGDVERGDRLWLAWDRGTLGLFGYLSAGSLGGEEHRLFNRYGNVYPPGIHTVGNPDADDLLCFHWLRRWDYVRWRTGAAQGPLAPAKPMEEPVVEEKKPPPKPEPLPGVPLRPGLRLVEEDFAVRLLRLERVAAIEDFPALQPPAEHVFLILTLELTPTATRTLPIDTCWFVLLAENNRRYEDPLVYGPARMIGPEFQVEPRTTRPPDRTEPRNLRFGIPETKTHGHYVMDSVAVHFTSKAQEERLDLVYTLPADLEDNAIRFVVEGEAAPAEAAPGTRAP